MGAGPDPCAATCARKVSKYSSILGELQEEGIDYRPLVWSCWGRPGGDAQQAVRTIAAAAARRRGLGNPVVLERHIRSLIGAQIWRRAANMVLACLPDASTVVGCHQRLAGKAQISCVITGKIVFF